MSVGTVVGRYVVGTASISAIEELLRYVDADVVTGGMLAFALVERRAGVYTGRAIGYARHSGADEFIHSQAGTTVGVGRSSAVENYIKTSAPTFVGAAAHSGSEFRLRVDASTVVGTGSISHTEISTNTQSYTFVAQSVISDLEVEQRERLDTGVVTGQSRPSGVEQLTRVDAATVTGTAVPSHMASRHFAYVSTGTVVGTANVSGVHFQISVVNFFEQLLVVGTAVISAVESFTGTINETFIGQSVIAREYDDSPTFVATSTILGRENYNYRDEEGVVTGQSVITARTSTSLDVGAVTGQSRIRSIEVRGYTSTGTVTGTAIPSLVSNFGTHTQSYTAVGTAIASAVNVIESVESGTVIGTGLPTGVESAAGYDFALYEISLYDELTGVETPTVNFDHVISAVEEYSRPLVTGVSAISAVEAYNNQLVTGASRVLAPVEDYGVTMTAGWPGGNATQWYDRFSQNVAGIPGYAEQGWYGLRGFKSALYTYTGNITIDSTGIRPTSINDPAFPADMIAACFPFGTTGTDPNQYLWDGVTPNPFYQRHVIKRLKIKGNLQIGVVDASSSPRVKAGLEDVEAANTTVVGMDNPLLLHNNSGRIWMDYADIYARNLYSNYAGTNSGSGTMWRWQTPSSGTYTLSITATDPVTLASVTRTTAPIAFDAFHTDIQDAIMALDNIEGSYENYDMHRDYSAQNAFVYGDPSANTGPWGVEFLNVMVTNVTGTGVTVTTQNQPFGTSLAMRLIGCTGRIENFSIRGYLGPALRIGKNSVDLILKGGFVEEHPARVLYKGKNLAYNTIHITGCDNRISGKRILDYIYITNGANVAVLFEGDLTTSLSSPNFACVAEHLLIQEGSNKGIQNIASTYCGFKNSRINSAAITAGMNPAPAGPTLRAEVDYVFSENRQDNGTLIAAPVGADLSPNSGADEYAYGA